MIDTAPAYLKAYGPNHIEIISMIFESFEQGLSWLKANSGEMEWVEHNLNNHRYARRKGYIDNILDKDFLDKIFTSWYFGCGEVDLVELIELKTYNQPLCGFDLD